MSETNKQDIRDAWRAVIAREVHSLDAYRQVGSDLCEALDAAEINRDAARRDRDIALANEAKTREAAVRSLKHAGDLLGAVADALPEADWQPGAMPHANAVRNIVRERDELRTKLVEEQRKRGPADDYQCAGCGRTPKQYAEFEEWQCSECGGLVRTKRELAEVKLKEMEADQRATGDVLAGILGVERCADGNICHANDVALRLEAAEARAKTHRRRGYWVRRFADEHSAREKAEAIAAAARYWHECELVTVRARGSSSWPLSRQAELHALGRLRDVLDQQSVKSWAVDCMAAAHESADDLSTNDLARIARAHGRVMSFVKQHGSVETTFAVGDRVRFVRVTSQDKGFDEAARLTRNGVIRGDGVVVEVAGNSHGRCYFVEWRRHRRVWLDAEECALGHSIFTAHRESVLERVKRAARIAAETSGSGTTNFAFRRFLKELDRDSEPERVCINEPDELRGKP